MIFVFNDFFFSHNLEVFNDSFHNLEVFNDSFRKLLMLAERLHCSTKILASL